MLHYHASLCQSTSLFITYSYSYVNNIPFEDIHYTKWAALTVCHCGRPGVGGAR